MFGDGCRRISPNCQRSQFFVFDICNDADNIVKATGAIFGGASGLVAGYKKKIKIIFCKLESKIEKKKVLAADLRRRAIEISLRSL